MGTTAVGDITVGYDDEGAGEPLVLVHGHPFDRTMWTPQVAGLAAGRCRVIAADLRGYGTSTVRPGRTPLDVFAADLAGLLDRLGVPAATVAGLSMGGQIVLEFYRLFPGRVRRLVLADTSPRAETPAGRRARLDMADRLLREGMAGYADEVLPRMVSPRTLAVRPAVAGQVLAMMRRTPAEGAAAALRGRADRPDYTDLLGRIRVPTLVVVGRDDGYTPVAEAEFMHARIRGSRLAVVEDAGHLPNLEQPAEFNRVLRDFLDA